VPSDIVSDVLKCHLILMLHETQNITKPDAFLCQAKPTYRNIIKTLVNYIHIWQLVLTLLQDARIYLFITTFIFSYTHNQLMLPLIGFLTVPFLPFTVYLLHFNLLKSQIKGRFCYLECHFTSTECQQTRRQSFQSKLSVKIATPTTMQ